MEGEKKPLSFIERMKQQAMSQKPYGGEIKQEEAQISTRTCPNCGAGRALRDDLTECAYCGFEFMDTTLDEGIFINTKNQ